MHMQGRSGYNDCGCSRRMTHKCVHAEAQQQAQQLICHISPSKADITADDTILNKIKTCDTKALKTRITEAHSLRLWAYDRA